MLKKIDTLFILNDSISNSHWIIKGEYISKKLLNKMIRNNHLERKYIYFSDIFKNNKIPERLYKIVGIKEVDNKYILLKTEGKLNYLLVDKRILYFIIPYI